MFLKSIQHLSLGNVFTSSDKKYCNHGNCLVKAHFYFKTLSSTTYTMHIKNILNRIGTKAKFYQF